MARKNPISLTWLLLLGGGATALYLLARPGGIGGHQIGPGGQVPPPPQPTPEQRAAMDRAYRYRFAGGGRCFDYKERKFVPGSYCR